MKKLKIGVIGYGGRGHGITKHVLLQADDIEVIAVCDNYRDRVERAQKDVAEKYDFQPLGSTDFMQILDMRALDAVYVASSWETHIEVAIEALKKGLPVALEVGGAYTLESLWELVRTQERTQTPLMFMENCCFGKSELFATAMARSGVFGRIVYCHGCYGHYLCDEIAGGDQNRHYRLRNYLNRNCENYPTHELGPIAKLLNINRGNRMVSLTSVASCAAGMEEYINSHRAEYPELVGRHFRQGDIVNTQILCADGALISIRLDTTLPRSYSRELTVRGTLGMYEHDTAQIRLSTDPDIEIEESTAYYAKNLERIKEYQEKYLPSVWRSITEEEIKSGHGGMDVLQFRAFTEALRTGKEMPIDVYDAAAWMSITAISEQSVALGGAPQMLPDFTDGKWLTRKPLDVVEL